MQPKEVAGAAPSGLDGGAIDRRLERQRHRDGDLLLARGILGVLHPDRLAFPRRRRVEQQLHGEQRENEKQPNCGMDSADVAKAVPIVTVRAGTESLKCQAPDRRSG